MTSLDHHRAVTVSAVAHPGPGAARAEATSTATAGRRPSSSDLVTAGTPRVRPPAGRRPGPAARPRTAGHPHGGGHRRQVPHPPRPPRRPPVEEASPRSPLSWPTRRSSVADAARAAVVLERPIVAETRGDRGARPREGGSCGSRHRLACRRARLGGRPRPRPGRHRLAHLRRCVGRRRDAVPRRRPARPGGPAGPRLPAGADGRPVRVSRRGRPGPGGLPEGRRSRPDPRVPTDRRPVRTTGHPAGVRRGGR